MNKILAGIVLFNPNITRLIENINAISNQVDCLVLVENGSRNLEYREHLRPYSSEIVYIKNTRSMGIAYALNQILGYAYSHGYNWALTLDQDSVATQGMINTYLSIANDHIGIIGCKIEDRNYKIDDSWWLSKGTVEVNWVITSAAFTNVNAWKACGGFDTSMFIDWVDWDICEAMKKSGYKIYKTYKTKLIHELGVKTKLVKVRHHNMRILNHPTFRNYYSFRNRMYMVRKYKHISFLHESKELAFKAYTVLRYEKNKLKNGWAMLRGYIVGLFVKVNYNSITDDFLHIEGEKI